MEIGRNHPTNAERISKVRGRKNVFMLVKILGGQQFTEFERIAHWRLFFSELFLCQFEPGSQPITFENISHDEKMIIESYLPRFLIHFENCTVAIFEACERESLSGLIIFRTDILLEFQRIFESNQEPEVNGVIRLLIVWENACKKFVLSGYVRGKFEEINVRYLSSVTEEVERAHPWWTKEYKEEDDLIDSLIEEYDLTD